MNTPGSICYLAGMSSATPGAPNLDSPAPPLPPAGEDIILEPPRLEPSPRVVIDRPPPMRNEVNKSLGQAGAARVRDSVAEFMSTIRSSGLGADRVTVKRTGPSWLPIEERGFLDTLELTEFQNKDVSLVIRERWGGGQYKLTLVGPRDVPLEDQAFQVDIQGMPIVTTPSGEAAVDRLNEKRGGRGGGNADAAQLVATVTQQMIAAAQALRPPEPKRQDGEHSVVQMMLDAQRQSETRMEKLLEKLENDRKAETARRDADRALEREREKGDREDREKERQRQHELELERMKTDRDRELERARSAGKDPVAGISAIEKAGSALMDGFVKLAKARATEPEKETFDWRAALFDLAEKVGPPLIAAFPNLLNKGQPGAAAPPPIQAALPAPVMTRGAAQAPPPVRSPAPPPGAIVAGPPRGAATASTSAGVPAMSRGAAETAAPATPELIPPQQGALPTTDIAPPAEVVDAPPADTEPPAQDPPPKIRQVAMIGLADDLSNFVGTVAVAQTRQMKPSRAWIADEERLVGLFESLPEPMQEALEKEGWDKFATALPADGPGVAEIQQNMSTDIGKDWMRRFLECGPWTWDDEEIEETEDDDGAPKD